MLGVFVRFQFGADFDADKLREIARNARGKFAGMPGLISKTFAIDVESRAAVNFYVWETEQAARRFHTDAMMQQVTGLYGVEPRLDFVEIAQQVNND